jgi:hypothetical protein
MLWQPRPAQLPFHVSESIRISSLGTVPAYAAANYEFFDAEVLLQSHPFLSFICVSKPLSNSKQFEFCTGFLSK